MGSFIWYPSLKIFILLHQIHIPAENVHLTSPDTRSQKMSTLLHQIPISENVYHYFTRYLSLKLDALLHQMPILENVYPALSDTYPRNCLAPPPWQIPMLYNVYPTLSQQFLSNCSYFNATKITSGVCLFFCCKFYSDCIAILTLVVAVYQCFLTN